MARTTLETEAEKCTSSFRLMALFIQATKAKKEDLLLAIVKNSHTSIETLLEAFNNDDLKKEVINNSAFHKHFIANKAKFRYNSELLETIFKHSDINFIIEALTIEENQSISQGATFAIMSNPRFQDPWYSELKHISFIQALCIECSFKDVVTSNYAYVASNLFRILASDDTKKLFNHASNKPIILALLDQVKVKLTKIDSFFNPEPQPEPWRGPSLIVNRTENPATTQEPEATE